MCPRGSVSVVAAADETRAGYEDVTGGVHADAVLALEDEGILVGTDCGTGRFCPSEPLPRWVMAVWIARAAGNRRSTSNIGASFTDIDSSMWWAPHVERLSRLGITDGCATGPSRYCPQEAVTRAQMATFLTRAFRLTPSGPVGFADIGANIHQESINALATANITAGCATGPVRYCPQEAVTRAQMATFLARALNLLHVPDNPDWKAIGGPIPAVGLDGVKHIVYGRGGQQVWLVQADGTLFDSYPVSGRSNWPLPGRYKVLSKSRHTRSFTGGITMQFMVRFVQPPGKAATGFHDIPVYADGTPMQTPEELGQFRSAGCVRQRNDKAEQLYAWAPMATPVIVLA